MQTDAKTSPRTATTTPTTTHDSRRRQLNTEYRHGAAWNDEDIQAMLQDREDLIFAVRTANSKSKWQQKSRLGARELRKKEALEDNDQLLNPTDATEFKALSARANFLSQHRPDLAFASKELCRRFAAPTTTSMRKLVSLIKYLSGTPKTVYKYEWQQLPSATETFCDTDFAGCEITRRSTSGGAIMLGTRNVKHWSSAQTTIALSSGEAEVRGIARGAAHALGFRSIANDLDFPFTISRCSDAMAAIGIARGTGIGRVKHLSTTDLWVQGKIRMGDIQLIKIDGNTNPGYLFTKHMARPLMDQHLERLHVKKG